MRAGQFIRTPALLLAFVACLALAGSARAQGPSCEITGPETGCGPVEICGPEGDYEYYWARPVGGVEFTRCIIAVESGTYILWVTDKKSGEQGEPCFHKYEGGKGTECNITGPEEICKGAKAELCGPEGDFTYHWTGPGDFESTERCINVGEAGDYTLTVSAGDASCESTCKHELTVKEDCFENCPHTIGWWKQQCAQKNDGSTKLTVQQVTNIASCIDGKVGIFSWGDDFAGFCAALNPSVSNQRTNAKKQYAALLANLCMDELNEIGDNGDEVVLDPSTPVTCDGVATTIGALVGSMDTQLQALEGQNLTLNSVKQAYAKIIACATNINEGVGIGALCPRLRDKEVLATTAADFMDDASVDAEFGDTDLGTVRAFPNPFTKTVRLSYAVAPAGENVTLGVYDISGRLVKPLFRGFQAGGVHQSSWNGTDAGGARVRTGMYFIRGRVGERAIASRVMLVE